MSASYLALSKLGCIHFIKFYVYHWQCTALYRDMDIHHLLLSLYISFSYFCCLESAGAGSSSPQQQLLYLDTNGTYQGLLVIINHSPNLVKDTNEYLSNVQVGCYLHVAEAVISLLFAWKCDSSCNCMIDQKVFYHHRSTVGITVIKINFHITHFSVLLHNII